MSSEYSSQSSTYHTHTYISAWLRVVVDNTPITQYKDTQTNRQTEPLYSAQLSRIRFVTASPPLLGFIHGLYAQEHRHNSTPTPTPTQ